MITAQRGDRVSYKPPDYGIAEKGDVIDIDDYGRALVEWSDRTRTWVQTRYLKPLE